MLVDIWGWLWRRRCVTGRSLTIKKNFFFWKKQTKNDEFLTVLKACLYFFLTENMNSKNEKKWKTIKKGFLFVWKKKDDSNWAYIKKKKK